jgi:hypothetical protein
MIPPRDDRVALLYSGGTDSTLAAWKAAERFGEVHLLTYRRLGMFGVENSETNLALMRERFPPGRFVRPPVMPVDRLFRHTSYDRYLRTLAKHGLMVLTTCGLCKLAMHLRTLVYCVDHGVGHVWDGANKNMTIFPAQMAEVIELMKELYAAAGVRYDTPVYDYEDDQGINFGNFVYGLSPARDEAPAPRIGRTTGEELYELGILPEPDVKGKPHDKIMQGRCYQMVLFNLWVRWYVLERRSLDVYRRQAVAFYADRIGRYRPLVDELVRDPAQARLRHLIEERR